MLAFGPASTTGEQREAAGGNINHVRRDRLSHSITRRGMARWQRGGGAKFGTSQSWIVFVPADHDRSLEKGQFFGNIS